MPTMSFDRPETSIEDSRRDCELHARNLLGADGYQTLLDDVTGTVPPPTLIPSEASGSRNRDAGLLRKLFETEHMPLFDR
jgi:hypothetical protein